MPTKTNLGGVFMTDMDNRMSTGANISTEFVCGLIFDVNGIGTIDTLLTGDAAKNFANGNVVELELTQETLNLLKEQAGFICVGHGYYVDKVTIE